jgi:hypothetical protein
MQPEDNKTDETVNMLHATATMYLKISIGNIPEKVACSMELFISKCGLNF